MPEHKNREMQSKAVRAVTSLQQQKSGVGLLPQCSIHHEHLRRRRPALIFRARVFAGSPSLSALLLLLLLLVCLPGDLLVFVAGEINYGSVGQIKQDISLSVAALKW